jgi:hypothetical protein
MPRLTFCLEESWTAGALACARKFCGTGTPACASLSRNNGGKSGLRAAKATHSYPVFLSESAGAYATKDESKDPENAQTMNADSWNSHKIHARIFYGDTQI